MEYDEIKEKIELQQYELTNNYIINAVDLSLYKAYLKYYSYRINEEPGFEEAMIKYIHQAVTDIITNTSNDPIDKEWQDYYDYFVAGMVYEFKVIHERAVADFINTRFDSLQERIKSKGLTFDEAYEQESDEVNKDYEIDETMAPFKTEFSEWTIEIYSYCKAFAQMFMDILVNETDLTEDQINGMLNTICSPFDGDFNSDLICPQSGIVLDTKTNSLKICVPNLISSIINNLNSTKSMPVQNNIILINDQEQNDEF